jgi:2-methylisocitrate lyase-like PEP mutase family enzyme
MAASSQLRTLLRGDEIIVAPGAYDGITAKLIARPGSPSPI